MLLDVWIKFYGQGVEKINNKIKKPSAYRVNFQVHITRQHVNIFSNAIIDFTRCVTESVSVMLDIFLNIYSAIYDIQNYSEKLIELSMH